MIRFGSLIASDCDQILISSLSGLTVRTLSSVKNSVSSSFSVQST